MSEQTDLFIKICDPAFYGWERFLEDMVLKYPGRGEFFLYLRFQPELRNSAFKDLSDMTGGFTKSAEVNGSSFRFEPIDLRETLLRQGEIKPGEPVLCFKVTKKKGES